MKSTRNGKQAGAMQNGRRRGVLSAAAAIAWSLLSGCASMPISDTGVWEGEIPEPLTVKAAAANERPVRSKGVAPFFLTLVSGSRVGLEWNEGRDVRPVELVRGIPLFGLAVVPFYCYETLTDQTMQKKANETKIDRRRSKKYEAIIKRLEVDGRNDEAEHLREHSPFDPANHPPNPLAQFPQEKKKGTWNSIKTSYVEIFLGHRIAMERNEGRGIRRMERWHPLLITRIWEAFQAGRGRRMSDIAEKKGLDEFWLPKKADTDEEVEARAAPRVPSTG